MRVFIIDDAAVYTRKGILGSFIISRPVNHQGTLRDSKSCGCGLVEFIVNRRRTAEDRGNTVRAVILEAVRSVTQCKIGSVFGIVIFIIIAGRATRNRGNHRPIVTVVGRRPSDAITVGICQIDVSATIAYRPGDLKDFALNGQGRSQNLIVVIVSCGSDDKQSVDACVLCIIREEIITSHIGVSVIGNDCTVIEHIDTCRCFNVLRIRNLCRYTKVTFCSIELGISVHFVTVADDESMIILRIVS